MGLLAILTILIIVFAAFVAFMFPSLFVGAALATLALMLGAPLWAAVIGAAIIVLLAG